MTFLLLPLFALVFALAAGWVRERRARHASEAEASGKIATAYERLHEVSNSAMRGAPAVKWTRSYPVPTGADPWYWRVRVAGENLLLTDEQFKIARDRASHLITK